MRFQKGKFETCASPRMARRLYRRSLAGESLEEHACCQSACGILEGARDRIYVWLEDSQGFFYYTIYDSLDEARAAFLDFVTSHTECEADL